MAEWPDVTKEDASPRVQPGRRTAAQLRDNERMNTRLRAEGEKLAREEHAARQDAHLRATKLPRNAVATMDLQEVVDALGAIVKALGAHGYCEGSHGLLEGRVEVAQARLAQILKHCHVCGGAPESGSQKLGTFEELLADYLGTYTVREIFHYRDTLDYLPFRYKGHLYVSARQLLYHARASEAWAFLTQQEVGAGLSRSGFKPQAINYTADGVQHLKRFWKKPQSSSSGT